MLRELLTGWLWLFGYYSVMSVLFVALRCVLRIPAELFRKMFHVGIALSVFVFLRAFPAWQQAAATALLLGLFMYVAVGWAARFPQLPAFLAEREPGEVRVSLLLFFVTVALLISAGWGWLGPGARFLVAGPVMAWGFGDAAAALIGKRWGKKRLRLRGADPKKTAEGAVAMFGFAALGLFITLLACTGWGPYWCLLIAVAAGVVATGAELLSHSGLDTVTVPAATFLGLLALTGGLALAGLPA